MTMVDAAVMTVGAVKALIIEATLEALVTLVTMVTMVTMVGTVVVAGEQAAVEA